MIVLSFGSWPLSNWILILTLITGFGTIIGLGKYLLSIISDMKPDVKEIPVLNSQIKILFQLMEKMNLRLNNVETKLNKIERKMAKMEKKDI